MKHSLVCEILFKKLLHNSTYQSLTSTRCLLLLMTLWREKGKLRTTRAFLYLINFDIMSKCFQNIVALKKTSGRSLRPFCWYVFPTSLTIINKKCSQWWQNHGHSKVSSPVKVAVTIIECSGQHIVT